MASYSRARLIYLNWAAPIVECVITSSMHTEVSGSAGAPRDAEVASLLVVSVSDKIKIKFNRTCKESYTKVATIYSRLESHPVRLL